MASRSLTKLTSTKSEGLSFSTSHAKAFQCLGCRRYLRRHTFCAIGSGPWFLSTVPRGRYLFSRDSKARSSSSTDSKFKWQEISWPTAGKRGSILVLKGKTAATRG